MTNQNDEQSKDGIDADHIHYGSAPSGSKNVFKVTDGHYFVLGQTGHGVPHFTNAFSKQQSPSKFKALIDKLKAIKNSIWKTK